MSIDVPGDVDFDLSAVEMERGDLASLGIQSLLADLDVAVGVDDALAMMDRSFANVEHIATPRQVETLNGVRDSVAESLHLGELTPKLAARAFGYLHYYLDVPTITLEDLQAHRLRTWLATFAVANGWHPPDDGSAPVTYPNGKPVPPTAPEAYPAPGEYTPPTGAKTPGAQAVASGAISLGPRTFPTPGIGVAADNAISQALAVVAADSATVTARALESMLPGMAPGQVTTELRQYRAAIDHLVNQMRSVWLTLGHAGRDGVEGELTKLEHAVAARTSAPDRLEAQLRGDDRSVLLDMLHADQRRLDHQGTWIHTLATEIPKLAPLALVTHLEGTVAHLGAELSGTAASGLGDRVTQLQTQTQALRTEVDRLAKTSEECCEEFQQAQSDVGGKPAWRQLGKLLGGAFIVGWLVSLVDTAVAVMDAPMALDAVVTDTEAIAGWVQSATGIVPAVQAWGDAIAGRTP